MSKKYNILKRQSFADKIVLTLSEYPVGEELAFECRSLEEYYMSLIRMKDILVNVKSIPHSQASRAIGMHVDICRISTEDGFHMVKVEKD